MKVFQVSTGNSPVLGCLFALGVLAIAGLLAVGAGVFVLIAPVGLLLWRAIKALLPVSSGDGIPSADAHDTSTAIIDVEATVLPPVLQDESP